MIVFLNNNACGKTCLKKWNLIKDKLQSLEEAIVISSDDMEAFEKLKLNVISGERNIISAGGDGTLNYLINFIFSNFSDDIIGTLSLGALGLGSSNDFHKPFDKTVKGFPCKIDFNNCSLRDIGFFEFKDSGTLKRKYFIINASIGLTAHGNNLFNNDPAIKMIKKINSKLAIYYAVIRAIKEFANIDTEISSPDFERIKTKISNLALLKNSHFSGGLKYPFTIDYSSGYFNAALCEYMTRLDYLRLFKALSNSKFNKLNKTKSWLTDKLSVKAELPFFVEFDGEVVFTNSADFGILRNKLRVCKC